MKIGHTLFQHLVARDVDGARHELLNLVQRGSNGITIYFDGWNGLGAAAVLRSIAQVLESMNDPPPVLRFNRIIDIDCSIWKSKRVMQRRIAEELKLDCKAMFDKQDEEDDFNGVDFTSRDVIKDVAALINRTLRDISFVMIFLNGSDEEVVLSRFGIPEYQDHIIIWTFKKRFPSKGLLGDGLDSVNEIILSKLRYTDIFLGSFDKERYEFTYSEIRALVREEAVGIITHHPHMRDNDVEIMVTNYLLYGLFLNYSFLEGTGHLWATHGATYLICDGIIQGNKTREISKALYQEVSFECGNGSFLGSMRFRRQMSSHRKSFYYLSCGGDDDDDEDNSYIDDLLLIKGKRRWISTTSDEMIFVENMKKILARASLIFLPFEITDTPIRLPYDLMEHCNNLRVLSLSYCAFNFISPLFRHCHTLRFLGLDHCINSNTTGLFQRDDYITKWACLRNLWVLDLRYTNWDEILSKEKMDIMGNIKELNIEGFICWQYTAGKLEGILPYLERLRIVKPLCQVEASMDIDCSFVGKTKLELLNLSGDKDMKKLPTNLSKVTNLKVLVLDGCDGLENIVVSNSSLRSFSFDGYGSASNWTSIDELPLESSRPKCPDDKKDAKISSITLEGCTQLRNLFLRRLCNLVELDLSGCAVKILDFQTTVVTVPRLKRLFLLGCEHLCAIRWGPIDLDFFFEDKEVPMPAELELLCIDTRPRGGLSRNTLPSIAQKHFGLQVHVVTADAKLVRSLYDPIVTHVKNGEGDCFFDICITSSNIICNEKTSEEHHVVVASPYDDVFIELGEFSLTPMQAFPQPPASRSDRHIEIGYGSCNIRSEMEVLSTSTRNLLPLMAAYAESLHMHDTSTSHFMPPREFESLKWCRVERCSRLDQVFPPPVLFYDPHHVVLKIMWASDLRMAQCIWSKSQFLTTFGSLEHLHLRSCPCLQFALPVWTSSFPMLRTLHIIHCGSLIHVFVLDNKKYDINSSIVFPKLTTIHLHDVPALQQICEAKMIAPKLKVIRTRGCWSLRRLPALELRRPWWRRRAFFIDNDGEEGKERRRPTVEMEKDVWDALEWDGVESGHHPSLYEAPVHSRYYKRRGLLRTTVLR